MHEVLGKYRRFFGFTKVESAEQIFRKRLKNTMQREKNKHLSFRFNRENKIRSHGLRSTTINVRLSRVKFIEYKTLFIYISTDIYQFPPSIWVTYIEYGLRV